jgi:hypothetical protein
MNYSSMKAYCSLVCFGIAATALGCGGSQDVTLGQMPDGGGGAGGSNTTGVGGASQSGKGGTQNTSGGAQGTT